MPSAAQIRELVNKNEALEEENKRSGIALLALINDILDFSKIESGELDFETIAFDPELLIYDVCDLVRPKIGKRA